MRNYSPLLLLILTIHGISSQILDYKSEKSSLKKMSDYVPRGEINIEGQEQKEIVGCVHEHWYFRSNYRQLPLDQSTAAKISLHSYVRRTEGVLNTTITKNGNIINLKESGFRPERKTVFIVHGYEWMERNREKVLERMRRTAIAYLEYEDVNVIIVEWFPISKMFDNVQASLDARIVAKLMKNFAAEIVSSSSNAEHWGPLHLIGFGSGAHLVAMMANHLKVEVSQLHVQRITGLDPPHPCVIDNPEFSLDKGDAPFVDVIHTNGHKYFNRHLGLWDPIGHVDFYVNGGQFQVGCSNGIESGVENGELNLHECSHRKSIEYFIESLEVASKNGSSLIGSPYNFSMNSAFDLLSTPCSTNCQFLGINAKPELEGNYFVAAAKRKPFHEIGVKDQLAIGRVLLNLIAFA